MKKYILLQLFILIPILIYTQTNRGTITGKITDQKGNPLPFANVVLHDTQYGDMTNDEGYFTIEAPAGDYELQITMIGYLSQVLPVNLIAGKIKEIEIPAMEEDLLILDQVIVKGKSVIQEIRETPFNIVALDAKSFYNTTMDLAHLLDKASGIRIRETGGVGSDMSVTLNGFTGRHVKIFMDGVPMQGFGAAFQLNNIPVSVAERIEVYKGVVPIEFGTDALGGVINIVTNQTTNSFLDASYSFGSFNTHRTSINTGHTFKSGISLQLDAFQNYSDNDYKVKTEYWVFAGPDENGDVVGAHMSPEKAWVKRFNDTYRNESVIARIGVVGKSWADRMLFSTTYGQVRRGIQNQADMRHVFGERSTFSRSILSAFTYDKRNLIKEGLSVRMTANYNHQRAGSVDTSLYRYNWLGEKEIRQSRGETGNYVLSDYTSSNQSATAHVGYRIAKQHSLALSNVISGYVRKPVLEEIPIDERTARDSMDRTSLKNTLGLSYRFTYRKKWNTHLFAKHYLNQVTGPFEISENGRTNISERKEYVTNTGYGIATTYFLSDLQLKASAERAYRLPTDRELFGDEILETGNITLRPENSMNYNLGATFNRETSTGYNIHIDVSGYYRDTRDFIKTTLQSNTQTQSYTYGIANHGRVTNIGTDAEVRVYYKNKAMIGVTGTYMNIRDKEPRLNALSNGVENPSYGSRMPNLPYFFGNTDAAYYIHDLFGKGNVLNFTYTLNFVEKMFLHAPNMGYIDSKNIIPRQLYSDFSASYLLKNGLYNFTLEIRNIENAFLYDRFSLQKPGRSFSVKFRYYLLKRRAE